MNNKVDVLAVMDAEAETVNRIRRSLGDWLRRMEDTNWAVNGSSGPDDNDLCDLNNTVIRLREARAAVAELIELMHEANAKYIPRPTSINTKRLATQVAFNDRLDALLFRIGSQS